MNAADRAASASSIVNCKVDRNVQRVQAEMPSRVIRQNARLGKRRADRVVASVLRRTGR